ncbi:replication fork protection component Swi3-domain-containing protein [Aspergillus heterothallicus]
MADENIPRDDAGQSADFVDDLFDYDVGLDSILQEISTNTSATTAPKQAAPLDNSGVVLGLDEEVKVAKKRLPIAKLDENRLLTQAGIPKLRRSAKKNLRFKGKGHEFSDLARLLNFYQLWLDDLFPRAKFADGLAMIERLGHSKRIQTMRRTWIGEERPKTVGVDDEIFDTFLPLTVLQTDQDGFNKLPGEADDADKDLFMPDEGNAQPPRETRPFEDDDLDELDALLRDHDSEPRAVAPGGAPLGADDFDELDTLLKEQEDGGFGAWTISTKQATHDAIETESYTDELEAMDELDMLREIPQ